MYKYNTTVNKQHHNLIISKTCKYYTDIYKYNDYTGNIVRHIGDVHFRPTSLWITTPK